MKINTLSQNNPAFGVRIPIKEATISELKQRQRLIANPQLDKPAGEKVLDTICDKIMNTTQENSYLIYFLQTAVSKTKKIKELLEQSGKTLERAFWETCDKFFDVQLVANDKDKNIDNISDAKIKEDDYLTRIFHPQNNNREISLEKRKPIIEYCIKNYYYSENEITKNKFCKKLKDELNLDMEVSSIRDKILGPIIRLPGYYNGFKNATQKEEQTFTKFKKYLKEKPPMDSKSFYNSGNGEILIYTIETFKKYVPAFKEEFVFAEETQANTNTIGKKTKKSISKEQSSKDAVSFIDYYIANITKSNLTVKSIYSALFDTNVESNPNENHVSLITVQKWKFTINKIKETLEQDPNKTNEQIKNDIRNKCYSNSNYILTKKELFSRAINKLRALNKTTNDNTVEKNDDKTQTKTNTRASIKRTHELDSSEPKAMDNTEKNDEAANEKQPHLAEKPVSDSFKSPFDILYEQLFLQNKDNEREVANEKRPHLAEKPVLDSSKSPFDILYEQLFLQNKDNKRDVFNTKDTSDEINMFETKRQHLFPNQGAPILPNLNNNSNNVQQKNVNMSANNRQHLFPNQGAPILSNLNNNSNNVQQKNVNLSSNNRQHLFPNQGAPILPNLNNNSNNVQQKNVYEIHTNNIKKNNVAKKRERHEIDLQARKMMIAYSLFKSKDLKLCKAREITNNIKNDLNITVTGNSMYNTLGPMHKLVDIYNKFKIDDNCKDLPKTIEIFHAYVMKVIDEYLKDKPIINDKSMFYFTVAAMANVFEGKIQFENSLNLEDANKDVKKYFDELKNKGIKNETKYITY